MPRYRNVETGAVVNAPEEKFANLVGYEEVKAAAKADPAKAAPAKTAAK